MQSPPLTRPADDGARGITNARTIELSVEVTDLTKVYPGGRGRDDVHALSGLSFAIEAGTVYGLLGPNGAGKSTTTKILTTLSRPTSGIARVCGMDVTTMPDDVRRAIGYVSQGTGADPIQTPRENLAMAARLRGLPKAVASSKAESLLAQFDLTDAADRTAGKLSGGMRRKLDVAMGLIHSPSVLFLDEPTTGLDPEARASMWQIVRELAAEGTGMTVVLTTHHLEEADELADRIAIIDKGNLVIEGSPSELKATLNGDAVSVDLVEPDEAAVRRATGRAADAARGLGHDVHDISVEVRGTGGRVVVRTEDGPALVGPLVSALDSEGVRFGAVLVSRPSLDDVYLHYAGHSFDEVN